MLFPGIATDILRKVMKRVAFVMVMAMLLAISATCFAEKGSPEVVLRLSEDQSIDYPTTRGCQYFADLVEERTDGRIHIEVYDSGTLGDTTAVVEQLQYGAIDMIRCGTGDLTSFSQRLGVLILPYLYSSTENYYNCMDSEVAQDILKMEDADGLIGLCYFTNGSRSSLSYYICLERFVCIMHDLLQSTLNELGIAICKWNELFFIDGDSLFHAGRRDNGTRGYFHKTAQHSKSLGRTYQGWIVSR